MSPCYDNFKYFLKIFFLNIFIFPLGRGRGQVPFANLGGGGGVGGAAGGRQRDGAAELPREGGGGGGGGAAIGGPVGGGGTSPPPVSFCDIMTVFQRAVREVRAGQAALELGEARGGDSTYFNRTIVILLHLVCLFTKLLPHLEKEQVQLK